MYDLGRGFLVVISIITFPAIISLNMAVIVAVKTKARLNKTNSNIVLAC